MSHLDTQQRLSIEPRLLQQRSPRRHDLDSPNADRSGAESRATPPNEHPGSLQALPDELVIHIAEYLDHDRDLAALCRSCWHLYSPLIRMLYQNNARRLDWRRRKRCALDWAIDNNQEGTVRHCIASGCWPQFVARYCKGPAWARLVLRPIELGHLNILDLLRQHGLDIDHPEAYCRPSPRDDRPIPLLVASMGSAWRSSLARESTRRMANVLVERGADISTPTEYGNVLHIASYLGWHEVVVACLERGADVNEKGANELPDTPLISALQQVMDHLDTYKTIEILLHYGADINRRNHSGFLPLELADGRSGHRDFLSEDFRSLFLCMRDGCQYVQTKFAGSGPLRGILPIGWKEIWLETKPAMEEQDRKISDLLRSRVY